MRDLCNDITIINALNIQTINSNTTTAGVEIDRATYQGESLTFVLQTGTVTDGDYLIALTHGDATGVLTAVADADLIGTEAAGSFTADGDDNKTGKIGYVGNKRFVKASIVSTNTSSGAVLGMTAIIGHLKSNPDATQTR
jgi:hypothetical protein